MSLKTAMHVLDTCLSKLAMPEVLASVHEDDSQEARQSHRSGAAMPISVRNESHKWRHILRSVEL